jgi:hypothetical protein
MTPQVKMALIIGVAIVAATSLYLYFTPYQQCVRAVHARFAEDTNRFAKFQQPVPEAVCLQNQN